jgi:hypothetical protein
VDVGAVARLVGDGLGGEGRPHGHAGGDAPDRLAIDHLIVGGTHGGGVADRELLLAVAELGMAVLGPQALALQGVEQGHRVVVGLVEAGGGVTQAVVDGDQPVPAARGVGDAVAEGELGFVGGDEGMALAGQGGDGLAQEGARAGRPGGPVGQAQVRQHGRRAGGVGQADERGRIRDDADLADRAEMLDALKLVEHVHRHHRHGVPDAGAEPFGEQGA